MNDTTFDAVSDNAAAPDRVPADTAEAEKEKIAAAGLGKFGSVDALIAAYSSLEAEFTRRSQRLKELEEGNKTQNMPQGAPSPKPQNLLDAVLGDENVKAAVIGQYLQSVSSGKTVPLTIGGMSSAAPRVVPKTVKEAGALAQTFLKN